MSSFKDLKVWCKAMDLAEEVYKVIKYLPTNENYALSDQIRRSAISIPSNIAEGSGRASAKDCVHFLSIARGSLYELMTQLEIAERRGYGKVGEELKLLTNEVARMLTRMLSRRI